MIANRKLIKAVRREQRIAGAEFFKLDGTTGSYAAGSGQGPFPPGPGSGGLGILLKGQQGTSAPARHSSRDPGTFRSGSEPQTPRQQGRPTSGPGQGSLQSTKRRRTVLQHLQTMARPRDTLRQARTDLPRRSRPPCHHHLAQGIRRHALVLSQHFTQFLYHLAEVIARETAIVISQVWVR